jgi:hypothetical protein
MLNGDLSVHRLVWIINDRDKGPYFRQPVIGQFWQSQYSTSVIYKF